MVDNNAPAGGIVLSRLSKSYGQVGALRSIDLAIAPGETVALLGPNGAGKSTTIDMILGLGKPDGADAVLLRALPGVSRAELHGEAVTLSCADSDTALRALLGGFTAVRDIEVRG